MNETRTLSQPTYDRAVAMLGLDQVIELITSLGFYTMVAIMLNGFDAPVPGGERPSAQYEWFAHARHALEAGVSNDVIEAIRHRRKPDFERDDERLIYDARDRDERDKHAVAADL